MNGAVDYTDFVHTGPGTLAGRYLRSFWQPVARVQDLASGQAIPILIMNERFTLYRGESGAAYVVAFRCAHRGTQLSTGWVEGDAIRCLYHGWKYDRSGQCIEQPGEDESFKTHVKIRSYPTQEYLGLIFAYLGEGEPPPIKRFPDFEEAPELAVGPPQLWPCNYFNRIDNACDPMHVGYTHSESLRRVDRGGSDPRRFNSTVTAEETSYGVMTTVADPGQPLTHIHFHMPNINQLRAEENENPEAQGATPWGDRLFWRVPVDDNRCVSYLVGMLKVPSSPEERERRRRMAESVTVSPNDAAEDVLAGRIKMSQVPQNFNQREMFWVEDYVTEVGQGPIAPRADDRLGRRDVGIALLRKIWQRELTNLAEGRPLKHWDSPASLPRVTLVPVG